MFRGRFVHTIDSKNRMSLPSGFRSEIQRRSDRPPILTNAYQCLELHPFEDWQLFEERIVGIATIDPEAQAYARAQAAEGKRVAEERVKQEKAAKEQAKRDAEMNKKAQEQARKQAEIDRERQKQIDEAAARLKAAEAAYQAEVARQNKQ